jgi:hypothetical protein
MAQALGTNLQAVFKRDQSVAFAKTPASNAVLDIIEVCLSPDPNINI